MMTEREEKVKGANWVQWEEVKQGTEKLREGAVRDYNEIKQEQRVKEEVVE